MSGHSPGPWRVHPVQDGAIAIRDAAGDLIAMAFDGDKAVLIASVPALATEVEQLRAEVETWKKAHDIEDREKYAALQRENELQVALDAANARARTLEGALRGMRIDIEAVGRELPRRRVDDVLARIDAALSPPGQQPACRGCDADGSGYQLDHTCSPAPTEGSAPGCRCDCHNLDSDHADLCCQACASK